MQNQAARGEQGKPAGGFGAGGFGGRRDGARDGPSDGARNGPRDGPRDGARRGGPRRKVEEAKTWEPRTHLGRLVKAGVITEFDSIYNYSVRIKEAEIIDAFFASRMPGSNEATTNSALPLLVDEVIKVKSVQKQTRAGQRTRFRALVVVGDHAGHIGVGAKVSKEAALAIRGAIIVAKLSIVPVRRGYWGNIIGLPHTVPVKVTGKSASVQCRLIPAPRGSGVVGSPVVKKVLSLAGVADCFTSTKGSTRTEHNMVNSCVAALARTYSFSTPSNWVGQKPTVALRDIAIPV